MWQLISTADRRDASGAVLDAMRSRPSLVRRLRIKRIAMRAERLASEAPMSDRIAVAFGPIAERYGMGAPNAAGDRVCWDIAPPDRRRLDVVVDQAAQTIDIDLDGRGLAEFITGRRHEEGRVTIRLADDLDAALPYLVPHLDRLCETVITPDR